MGLGKWVRTNSYLYFLYHPILLRKAVMILHRSNVTYLNITTSFLIYRLTCLSSLIRLT